MDVAPKRSQQFKAAREIVEEYEEQELTGQKAEKSTLDLSESESDSDTASSNPDSSEEDGGEVEEVEPARRKIPKKATPNKRGKFLYYFAIRTGLQFLLFVTFVK
jgi:hypothetical protein